MEYTLKDKIQVTEDFLEDLINKSWQEIEHLQNQIKNIEENTNNVKIIQLLKNLLTSYYVFTGGLESLDFAEKCIAKPQEFLKASEEKQLEADTDTYGINNSVEDENIMMSEPVKADLDLEITNSEPFEYFVDFDEPVGDPWTDEDLYNN